MPVADLGRGVFVSDVGHCDAEPRRYELGVHIYRDSQPVDCRCGVIRGERPGGLVVRYSEGEPLGRMSVPLADVVGYARRPGSVLVHCQFGMYRAPMLAMVCLVARGISPAEAVGRLLTAQWRDRGVAFFLADAPMCDLLRFWESFGRA
jgi:hypothetical protein